MPVPQPEFGQLDAGLHQHADGTAGARIYDACRTTSTKLNYQLNANHSLAYSAQYNSKSLPNSGASAFVDSASTSLTDFPYWIQGASLTSVLSNRSTLEVKWGEFGWKWWTRPGADEIAREDLDTRLMRGGRQAPFIDRSHHMNISGVWSREHSAGTRAGSHTMKIGYGYLFEGAPYTYLAPKDSIKTFWRGGFKTPAEIETYDTPFDFREQGVAPVAFVNDTWNVKRLSFNGGFRFDSFLPYYDEQGKAGDGPVSGGGHLSRVHVPSAERPRAARVVRLRRVRNGTHGDQGGLWPVHVTTPAR